MSHIRLKCPDMVKMQYVSHVPDSLRIVTNTDALPKMLRQMLDNANQFTKQGTITLECMQNADKSITFMITDTGIGIAPEDEERIFVPFLKLDYYAEGLGIGLMLIRRGAEVLGGTFIYDNTYKEGTRFVLNLPQEETSS